MALKGPAKVALDEDVRSLLGVLLRERGWDALSVIEAGRRERSDSDQLVWASKEGRLLITHNAADFARLATEWAKTDRRHAGLVIARQAPVGQLLRATLTVLGERPSAADWENRVVWLAEPPGSSGRRRRRK